MPVGPGMRAALAAILLAALAVSRPSRAVAQPLAAQGVENLAAFARLAAVVRFFHPSDGVAAADWNALAVDGVSAIERAADRDLLGAALRAWLAPVAPTVRIAVAGASDDAAPVPPIGPRILAWRHYGGRFSTHAKSLSSDRIEAGVPPFATLSQTLAPGALAGRSVRLRAAVRAALGEGASAALGLRVERRGGVVDPIRRAAIDEERWRTVGVEVALPADAERISVVLLLSGSGRVWIDDVALGSATMTAPLADPGFEEGPPGEQPRAWFFPYDAVKAGYHLVSVRGDECASGACARLESDATVGWLPPRPEAARRVELGRGLVAWVPLSLYADAEGTLPHAPPGAGPHASSSERGDPAGPARARSQRLAAAILAWGIVGQLHPFLAGTPEEWSATLRASLPAIAESPDRAAARDALACLVASVPDARLAFSDLRAGELRRQPLLWDWIEGRWLVTAVGREIAELHPGDEVIAIDDQSAEAVLGRALACAPGATAAGRRSNALEQLAFGPAGAERRLSVVHADGRRADVRVPFTLDPLTPPSTLEPRAPLGEAAPGILYADLRRLADPDVEEIVRRAGTARGIVFDLRGSTDMGTVLLSHLAAHETRSPSWQLPILTAPDGDGRAWLTTFWTIPARAPRFRAPVAFLLDSRSWGLPETRLAMVEQERWGALVGGPSGASNGIVNHTQLPGGWGFTWSASRVLKADGSVFQGIGVQPTDPVEPTRAGIAAGRDEVLERAVALLAARR